MKERIYSLYTGINLSKVGCFETKIEKEKKSRKLEMLFDIDYNSLSRTCLWKIGNFAHTEQNCLFQTVLNKLSASES